MFLVVNYHYVGSYEFPHPGIHSLSIDNFIRQLEWLGRRFEFVGLSDIDQYLSEGRFPVQACLLTFDDGLRCHFEIVAPILERFALPAAFFVSSQPIVDNIPTTVHKLHYIRANISPETILDSICSSGLQEKECFDPFSTCFESIARAHYRYDTVESAKIKYLICQVLPPKQAERIVDTLFAQFLLHDAEFCRDWYMTRNEIRDLHRRHACIGSHAVSHLPLANLPASDVQSELVTSKRSLEEAIEDEVTSVSYPSGSAGSRVARFANIAGYYHGFTMERKWNQSLDDRLLLSRIDCNDLPVVGKQPRFEVVNGEWHTLE